MKNNYLIKIFEYVSGREQLLASYEFNGTCPRIPKKGENLIINGTNYRVVRVNQSLEDFFGDSPKNEVWYEIMVYEVDIDKEWWE